MLTATIKNSVDIVEDSKTVILKIENFAIDEKNILRIKMYIIWIN